jgi:hypothetical protein
LFVHAEADRVTEAIGGQRDAIRQMVKFDNVTLNRLTESLIAYLRDWNPNQSFVGC